MSRYETGAYWGYSGHALHDHSDLPLTLSKDQIMRISTTANRWGLLAVALLSLLCVASSCDNDPTGPGITKEAPFYYMDIAKQPPRLYTLNPPSGRIDSTDVAWMAREGITVSATGDRLYLADRNQITVIDTDSLQLLATLTYEPDNPVSVSPDGSLIAISSITGLTVLRTEDYGVEFTDTVAVGNCEFSADSRSLYCGCAKTEGVYHVDLADSVRAGECLNVGEGATQIVFATPDQSKLLLYKILGTSLWSFEVYDILADSIVFRDVISPGAGRMVLSPDGKMAFYTSPGTGDVVTALMGFKVFDVENNRLARTLVDPDYFSDTGYSAPPKFLSVSPDSRWLGVIGSTRIPLAAFVYDIAEDKMVERKGPVPPMLPFLTNISAQKRR